MCGVGSLTTKTECMSGHSSRSSSRSSSINNNCSETVDHHFSEESKKMNGGGSSEKSEDGGRSTGSPSSPAGRGGSGSGSASPTSGCPSCRQLLCSCGKSPSSAASLLNYQRLASTVPSLVYPPNPSNPNASSPYSPDQVAYLAAAAAAAAEHQALYAAAGGGLPDMKEGGLGPSGWAYPSMYHPYDPGFAAAAAAAAAAYPFNGYSMDMNGSRRKNATRETTSTLKAWLAEHRKNPYPTKGEKIMLAIITKMTLTQVSTWFANARRRLKKENKMTWEPRNRPDDDDDDVNISDSEQDERKDDKDNERLSSSTNSHHVHGKSSPTESSCSDVSKEGASTIKPNQKPRIWSVADLAGSDSRDEGERREGPPHAAHLHHPHHLIPHPHLLNLHNNHHSNGSSSGGSSSGSGGHHPPGSAAAAAAAAAAAFLHNPHLRNSHNPHLQQLHHQHLAHAGSNHHPGASSLPGSAFSPLSSRSTAHSEAIYRGLYPLPHPAAYHSSSTADNP